MGAGGVMGAFQSAPSVKRATRRGAWCGRIQSVSIRALREEGDVRTGVATPSLLVFQSAPSVKRATNLERSIDRGHKFQSAPSVKRATIQSSAVQTTFAFQSAPSVKRATMRGHRGDCGQHVSIRALREEGDCRRRIFKPIIRGFNPRPP